MLKSCKKEYYITLLKIGWFHFDRCKYIFKGCLTKIKLIYFSSSHPLKLIVMNADKNNSSQIVHENQYQMYNFNFYPLTFINKIIIKHWLVDPFLNIKVIMMEMHIWMETLLKV